MSNYQGYLIAIGGNRIPNRYFTEYSSTPSQRQESDAQVDQNGYLHRATMPHARTSIKFTTHILNLQEKIDFQNRITYTNYLQRQVYVTYWNDEINNYSSGYFYLPDVTFSVMDASDRDILYNPISFELVEY